MVVSRCTANCRPRVAADSCSFHHVHAPVLLLPEQLPSWLLPLLVLLGAAWPSLLLHAWHPAQHHLQLHPLLLHLPGHQQHLLALLHRLHHPLLLLVLLPVHLPALVKQGLNHLPQRLLPPLRPHSAAQVTLTQPPVLPLLLQCRLLAPGLRQPQLLLLQLEMLVEAGSQPGVLILHGRLCDCRSHPGKQC